jgi:hypothetical protein
MIFPMFDSLASSEIVNKLLIWMPSHKSASVIGKAFKSDGSFVNAIDWRANRLADCLARLAANELAAPDLAFRIFQQALSAAGYCAALLGTVTYRANHHQTQVLKPDGAVSLKCCRDSAPGKRSTEVSDDASKRVRLSDTVSVVGDSLRGSKRAIGEVATSDTLAPPSQPSCMRVEPQASVRPAASLNSLKSKAAEKAHLAQKESAFWSNWSKNCSERPALATPSLSSADRITAIRRRLHDKQSA